MVADFFDQLPVSATWPGGLAGRWGVPPRIELEAVSGRLLIDELSKSEGWHTQERASHKMLNDFIDLASAPDDKILKFARKWGVLELCVHDLPYWHPYDMESQLFPKGNQPFIHIDDFWPNHLYPEPVRVSIVLPGDSRMPHDSVPRRVSLAVPEDCRIRLGSLKGMSLAMRHRLWVYKKDLPGWEGVECVAWEPLNVWRSWSRRAGALVMAAQHLHSDPATIAPKDTWRDATALPDGMICPDWRPPKTVEEGWQAVSHLLTHWISLAEIRPVIRATKSRQVTMEMPARGLFGALSVQLLFAVTKKANFLTCFECSQPYPGRYPKPGNRNYCPTCRDEGAGARNLMRERRRKVRKPAQS